MLAKIKKSWRRELAHLRGHPFDLFMATLLPVIGCVILNAVFIQSALTGIPAALVDQDHSSLSRKLQRMLAANAAVALTQGLGDLQSAWSAVESGRVTAVVYVPGGFEREALSGRQAHVFIYYNQNFFSAGNLAGRGLSEVVAALNAEAVLSGAGLSGRPIATVPLALTRTTLYNPTVSYEYFLVPLLVLGFLHLAATLALVSALGRELRDHRVDGWQAESGHHLLAALIGKLLPYVLMFTAFSLLGLWWPAYVRGWGCAGSWALILAGQLLMYLAYAVSAVAIVGLTGNFRLSLSLTAVYCAPGITFSGITFPIGPENMFAYIWSSLLPYTAYMKLQTQQLVIGAPWSASVPLLGLLLLFIVVPALPAYFLFRKRCRTRSDWGAR